MKIFDAERDVVIRSAVATGKADYEYALARFYPLIDRFDEQRKLQRPKFYNRLKADIISGCVMPPITLAFITENVEQMEFIEAARDYIEANYETGYILDGMQRLNTLHSASVEEGFQPHRPLYFNAIFAEKYDLLLYRMITLNNGQKPMTVRHQVEMLTGNLVRKLLADRVLENIGILSEKETESSSPRGAFRLVDVAAAYLAFLTNSAHNQNSRFIEEKLDEILVGKVMNSSTITEKISFQEIIQEIDRLSESPEAKQWLKGENNLIGFSLGVKESIDDIRKISPEDFVKETKIFENAFQAINPSKVNVGKFRRDLTRYFVAHIGEDMTVEDLTENFFELTAT